MRTRSADYMRILVVDDDDAIRASIRRTLGREIDADVSEASNGADALDHLVRYQCDLVLLDIQMPGMNGIKTLQAIRRSPNRAALPVIMLTGTADEQHVREAASLGVQDYMLKPVEPEALVLRLSEVLMRTTRGPAAGVPAEVLTLEKHDRVLVIEPDRNSCVSLEQALGILPRGPGLGATGFAAGPCAEATGRGLPWRFTGLCAERDSPWPNFASTRDCAASRSMAWSLPNGSTPPATCSTACILPRTLAEDVWAASVDSVITAAADGAAYLEIALDHASRYLTSVAAGVVLRSRSRPRPGAARVVSRLDFDAGKHRGP